MSTNASREPRNPWPERVSGLLTSGLQNGPAPDLRDAQLDLVNLPDPLYLDQMGIISAGGVTSVSEMEGKKVRTVDGYLWVNDLQKVLGDSLRLYPSSVDAQATFPMTKDDPDILKAFNKTIAELHSDGTIVKILEANGLPASERRPAPRA
jgi:polar amino acid transport system substrate-binding protein